MDTIIADYETSFGDLKIEFIMAIALQATLTNVRILEGIKNIGEF